jgi:hypothetical protein
MSVEILVLMATHQSPTSDAWQKALKEYSLPVQFSELTDLTRHTGFMPLTVRGQRSGFYFLIESYTEARTLYPVLANVKLQEPVVYSLQFGGHFLEGASAFYAAAVLVARFGGVAFDPQGGTFVTQEQLVEQGKLCEGIAEDHPELR